MKHGDGNFVDNLDHTVAHIPFEHVGLLQADIEVGVVLASEKLVQVREGQDTSAEGVLGMANDGIEVQVASIKGNDAGSYQMHPLLKTWMRLQHFRGDIQMQVEEVTLGFLPKHKDDDEVVDISLAWEHPHNQIGTQRLALRSIPLHPKELLPAGPAIDLSEFVLREVVKPLLLGLVDNIEPGDGECICRNTAPLCVDAPVLGRHNHAHLNARRRTEGLAQVYRYDVVHFNPPHPQQHTRTVEVQLMCHVADHRVGTHELLPNPSDQEDLTPIRLFALLVHVDLVLNSRTDEVVFKTRDLVAVLLLLVVEVELFGGVLNNQGRVVIADDCNISLKLEVVLLVCVEPPENVNLIRTLHLKAGAATSADHQTVVIVLRLHQLQHKRVLHLGHEDIVGDLWLVVLSCKLMQQCLHFVVGLWPEQEDVMFGLIVVEVYQMEMLLNQVRRLKNDWLQLDLQARVVVELGGYQPAVVVVALVLLLIEVVQQIYGRISMHPPRTVMNLTLRRYLHLTHAFVYNHLELQRHQILASLPRILLKLRNVRVVLSSCLFDCKLQLILKDEGTPKRLLVQPVPILNRSQDVLVGGDYGISSQEFTGTIYQLLVVHADCALEEAAEVVAVVVVQQNTLDDLILVSAHPHSLDYRVVLRVEFEQTAYISHNLTVAILLNQTIVFALRCK